MDPNQSWQELSNAFNEGDSEHCRELASGLAKWVESGGFPPTITRHQNFDRLVTKTVCEAIVAGEVE